MGWIILLLLWIAVTMIATIPYVNQIENLRDDKDKVFSYILGPAILLSGLVVEILEKLGIEFEDDDAPWKRY